ncbi:B-cell receptor-associated protein 31-like-domain-containing protein [Chytriomyces cf. hyalinus JEL632]|nr:B-cell receptor-associated protein 31-like-domain-containing protein [Chytriomyces cf. hyalinus JEL632]
MSIFNQITYFMLVAEIGTFLVLLVPMNFIPVRARKAAMNFGAKILTNDTVVWISRIILLIVGGVFADTLMRLQKLDSALHKGEEGSEGHHHHHHESPLEELQFKSKLFYSQRNMYLSLMSLFMTVVIYRRVKDIYRILQLEDSEDSNKTTIKHLKQQVEVMVKSAVSDTDKKSAAPASSSATTTTTSSSEKTDSKKQVVEESEIPASSSDDPTNSSAGMRKRK